MSISELQILYLVHDLADPAVRRRVCMLRDGGAAVTVAGFRRSQTPPSMIAGCRAVDFGRTYNGAFGQRIAAVLREAAWMNKYRALFVGANIVIARNLEMLALARRGAALCSKPPALVYECLDIHRLLLGNGLVGKRLRALEQVLARQAAGLITSSPAYVREYLGKITPLALPVRLVENKVYLPEQAAAAEAPVYRPRPLGPPWRIGWFGSIRCARSLALLRDLVQQNAGRVEVIIRGRPAYDQLPDFAAICAATPGLHFAGPYRNPEDLSAIYGAVHFNWAIDMYEEGANGNWCLPNRIYEGGLYHALPLAQRDVETGRYLARTGSGVCFGPALACELKEFFATMNMARYRVLAQQAAALPPQIWRYERSDCQELTGWLASLRRDHITQERAA